MEVNEFTEKLDRMPIKSEFSHQADLLKSRYGNEYLFTANSILKLLDKLGYDAVKVSMRYLFSYMKILSDFLGNTERGNLYEMKKDAFDDEKKMTDVFLPAVFASYAYSTISYERNHLFLNEFLPNIYDNAKIIEIGFAHGVYLWELMSKQKDTMLKSFNLSLHELPFVSRLFNAAGIDSSKYSLQYINMIDDFEMKEGVADFVIAIDVLEHVPNPAVVIAKMAKTLTGGGVLYLTSEIDTNSSKSLHLSSPSAVEKMITDVGLTIAAAKIYNNRDDFPESKDVSTAVAYVAKKK